MSNTSESPTPVRPARWKALAVLVFVFVFGIAVGVGGGALVLRHTIRQKIANGSGATSVVDRIQQATISSLDLTPAEQAAIAPEFEITRARVREERREIIIALREIALDTLQRVKAKLPAEKQILLENAAGKRLGPWGLMER